MATIHAPYIRGFARERDGAAGIEIALAAGALLSVSMLCFDLYSLVKVDTSGARAAVAIADYVSRDTAPNGEEITALGEYLHQQEFEVPADVAFVISAIRREPGDDPAVLLWSDDTIRFGNAEATAELAGECTRRGTAGWRAVLLGPPATSGMAAGEVAFVAEVCSRPRREGLVSNMLLAGDSYHMHVLPARDSSVAPSAPFSAPEEGTDPE